jgi:hypothetical protein
MHELAPGLWHWTMRHERIHAEVSSYYMERQRVLLDAMIPAEGLGWLHEHGPPEHILMTNRHHDRQAWPIRERFGCTVHCIRNGLHEIDGRGPVEPFEFGDEVLPGITAHEVDAICPDETALHLVDHRALACADGVIGRRRLAFVPDFLMDDPEDTKAGLRAAYSRLIDELDFDVLLLAHGDPIVGGAKQALRAFIDA